MLHNPSGLYQSEAPLNPLPYVNIAMQARQRRQAREDALDKYYRALPETINDKNIRDAEVPIINDYRDKIFQFGMQNKEALRNPKLDRGAAQYTLSKLMNEAKGVARKSQAAAQVDLLAGKSLMNKDNQYILNSDEYVADHALHNLPVTDPNHKTLDLTKFAADRPFDQNALIKRNADIKYSDGTPEITQHPTDPLSQIVTTRPVLDEENKKALFARAADDLHNNPIFAKHITKELSGTGQLQPLVKIANDVFKIPEDQLTDEGLAAAYEYSLLPVKQTIQKITPNRTAIIDKQEADRKAEWDRRNKITFAQSMQKIAANKQAGQIPEDLGYVSDNVSDEVGVDLDITQNGKTQRKRVVYVDQVDPERLDIITGRDLSKKKLGVKPIAFKGGKLGFYVNDDGDWEGENGQKISREAAKDRYVQSKAGTKFKAESGTKGSENTLPKVKTTTKSGLPVFH